MTHIQKLIDRTMQDAIVAPQNMRRMYLEDANDFIRVHEMVLLNDWDAAAAFINIMDTSPREQILEAIAMDYSKAEVEAMGYSFRY